MDAYKPVVPLHTALAQVSTSLADGKTNLGFVEVELNKISGTAQGNNVTLGSAQNIIDQYDAVTTQLQANVEAAQLGVQTWMNTTTWILSFVFVWLLVIQLGLGI